MSKSPYKKAGADGAGFFHCNSRSVGGALLCGMDPRTGFDCDHRREWIRVRLIELSRGFAVSLQGWAVTERHSHVLLGLVPNLPYRWSDEQVARRWSRLSRTLAPVNEVQAEVRYERLMADPGGLKTTRQRLGSLGWFMRFLKESVARAANREQGAEGRFWEARARCRSLREVEGMLACMAEVKLEPIWGGIADDLLPVGYPAFRKLLALPRGKESSAEDASGDAEGAATGGAGGDAEDHKGGDASGDAEGDAEGDAGGKRPRRIEVGLPFDCWGGAGIWRPRTGKA